MKNKNTKIYQLTLLGRGYNLNLGAHLQAYAIQRAIDILTNNKRAFYIDYIPTGSSSANILDKMLTIMQQKGLTQLVKSGVWYIVNRMNIPKNVLSKRKISRFYAFQEEYLSFTPETFYTFDELYTYFSSDKEGSIFVVGSDVVWSPRYNSKEHLKVYLLGFVKKGIKASYAASVGDPIPDDLKTLYRRYLPDFDFISVREESSARYLTDILPVDVEVVLDPTALLSNEEWIRISEPPPKIPNRSYVLVYDLYRSKEIVPAVIRFAKENDLDIVTYSYSLLHKIRSLTNIMTFYPYGPLEFLWLMANAKFVVTSSFHGTVFSVIFQKPFVAINPEPYAPVSRIKDFLNILQAEERLINDPEKLKDTIIKDIDWSTILRNLTKHKKHSLNYLKRVLRG